MPSPLIFLDEFWPKKNGKCIVWILKPPRIFYWKELMWLLTWTYRIQNYIRWRMNFNWMEIRNKNQDNISALPTSRPRPIYSVFNNNNINIHWIHIGYKFSPIARHSYFKFCLYGFALFRGIYKKLWLCLMAYFGLKFYCSRLYLVNQCDEWLKDSLRC